MINAPYFPLLALALTTFAVNTFAGIVTNLTAGRNMAGFGGILIVALGVATAGSYFYMVAISDHPGTDYEYQCLGPPYETC